MPPDLVEHLTRHRPEADLAVVEQAWVGVGAAGQQTYREYLDRAVTRRGRRERVVLLADQLVYGPISAGLPPPYRPGPYG